MTPINDENMPLDIDQPDPGYVELMRLVAELESLHLKIQELRAEDSSPDSSIGSMVEQLESELQGLLQEINQYTCDTEEIEEVVLEKDNFDSHRWWRAWKLLRTSVTKWADFVQRRLNGEYVTDEWGYDHEILEMVKPALDYLYTNYWRVQTSGIENIPEQGRALLVSNHSGQLPFDGAMIAMAMLNEHPAQRLVRTLYASWFPTVPFVSSLFVKCGQALATDENGTRLLEQDQLVAVFPEGIKGIGKTFKDRYHLVRFGRGGFVRMAIKSKAPIIPVSVVGAEEIYISLAQSETMARMIGFPFFPITLTWPWLGLLGVIPLPTKWYIDFGEPIPTSDYPPGSETNIRLVSQLSDQVRNLIQQMIYDRLEKRRSVFFG